MESALLMLALAAGLTSSAAVPTTSPDAAARPLLSVAVFGLKPKLEVPADLADLLTERLVVDVRELQVFNPVVGPRELAVRLSADESAQLVRCALDECAL